MKRLTHLFVVVVLLSGCTPDAYQQQADLQVSKLLRDRKEQTLGYQPKTPIAPTTVPTLTKRSYAKIPETRIAPPTSAPVEPATTILPYGPLGPEKIFAGAQGSPSLQLGYQAAKQQVRERLEYGPLPRDINRVRMDLFMSIKYAVEHSRNYQSQMEDLYLAALDVTLQRHLFEPQPFVTQSVNYDAGQLDANYKSALSATTTAGIKQQLPYGGQVMAQGLVTFVDALNDNSVGGENASAVISASIPLLRGAGMVNLEPLIQSERELVYQVRSFETFRRSFVVQIASAYFQLLTDYEHINNVRINYEQAVQLVDMNTALFAAGPAAGQNTTFLAVQQSITQEVTVEANLIAAQQSLESALDDFKVLIGMPVDENLDMIPVELNVNAPDVEAPDMAKLGQMYRLDLQTARDRIEDARRKVEVAKSQLLPGLDLTARGELDNRPDTSASELDSRSLNYSMGATLDLPVDRFSERNAYRSALISYARAQRSYVDLSETVLSDVRQAARAVEQAQQQVAIAERGVHVAQQQLEYATLLFTQGKTITRDITEAQTAILNAQNDLDSQRANFQINVLRFLQDTGTLRVDPSAGALGAAMDVAPSVIGQPINDWRVRS